MNAQATLPKDAPGADLRPVNRQPAAAPSRPPDATGKEYGLTYQAWEKTSYVMLFVYDGDGQLVKGSHQSYHGRGAARTLTPYHMVSDLSVTDKLRCLYWRRKRGRDLSPFHVRQERCDDLRDVLLGVERRRRPSITTEVRRGRKGRTYHHTLH